MSLTTANPVTAEQLLAMADDGFRYELVKGELIRMSPTGHEHGIIAMRIAAPLYNYIRNRNLGNFYASETGFILASNPDTVRAPDGAFVRRERIEKAGPVKGYWTGAPDLAIEVLSPSDAEVAAEAKVPGWLKAGTLAVWVVSPKRRTESVYRSSADVSILTDKDILDGADVVPGFQMWVKEIFGA